MIWKSAAISLLLVVGWTVYNAVRFAYSMSSGGLGAFSFGISEALVEFVVLTVVLYVLLSLVRLVRSTLRRRP